MIESIPFILSLCSVWAYGRKGLSGPVIGCICAFSFIVFGFYADIKAAALSNLFFLWLHFNNGRKIMNDNPDKIARDIVNAWANMFDLDHSNTARHHLIDASHGAAKTAGWWANLETGEDLIETGNFNIGEKLCLIHSEISEAMEGHRKDLNDDKLPHRKMIEVELADAVIRICDLLGALNVDYTESLSSGNHKIWYRPVNIPEHLATIHHLVSIAFDYRNHKTTLSGKLINVLFQIRTLEQQLDLDVGGAIAEKMAFNANRPDHKVENRKLGGGKAY